MYSNEQIRNAMEALNENQNWRIVREFILSEIENKKEHSEKDFEADANKFYLNTLANFKACSFLEEVINQIDSCKAKKINVISWS